MFYFYLSSIILVYFSVELFKTIFVIILTNEIRRISKVLDSSKLILLIIFLCSSIWLISSKHLISIWLAMECQSFSLILLLFFDNDNKIENIEAIIKYFVISAFGGIIFLVGIFQALQFSGSGSLSAGLVTESLNYYWIFLSSPLLLKIGISPLHVWIPEVYKGLSWQGLSLISVVPKVTLLYVLISLPKNSGILFFLGVLSIIVGSIGGLNQSNLKTLLGFSGIGHFGFILIILGMSSEHVSLCLFYVSIYLLTSISVLILSSERGKSLLVEFGNYFSNSWAKGIIFGILILSLLGFPPLSGFISKLIVLINSLKLSSNIFLILIILFFIMISSFYYLRLFKIIMSESKELYFSWEMIFLKKNLIEGSSIFLSFSIFFTIFLFLNPSILFLWSQFILNDFMSN